MIKFFRKIRKNLLSENKFSKYLIYAIGEIVLVVIGILIALAINNKNENRKETIAINNVLLEIKDDLLQDKAELEFSLEAHTKDLEAQLRVIKALDLNDSYNENLRTDFGRIYLARTFYSISKGYELLKEMNLSSSLDKNLRIGLTKYYEQDIPSVYREFEDDKMEFETYWLPYLRENFEEWEFGEYAVPYDYNQLLEDSNLISATKFNCVNLKGTIRELNRALNSASSLIEELSLEE
ncbi:hypothetical protein JQC67_11830 [Aurantibacter crassamenti]|uniref:DUF6090 family protein n=1 Tax=Aurantibacter crassamenti TaxID=1837375 RepID=UPI00193AA6A9|nr:DUF6090 family protein [Aurantibacter crassamenti]MBM1106832.1 hypothetical protein [Aurantibacter crassamenti]